MDNRFAGAVRELRNRVQNLPDADLWSSRGSQICEQVAGDYMVSDDELYGFMMSDSFLPEAS